MCLKIADSPGAAGLSSTFAIWVAQSVRFPLFFTRRRRDENANAHMVTVSTSHCEAEEAAARTTKRLARRIAFGAPLSPSSCTPNRSPPSVTTLPHKPFKAVLPLFLRESPHAAKGRQKMVPASEAPAMGGERGRFPPQTHTGRFPPPFSTCFLPMLRNSASGPEIGLPGRISADSNWENLKIGPPAGRRPEGRC